MTDERFWERFQWVLPKDIHPAHPEAKWYEDGIWGMARNNLYLVQVHLGRAAYEGFGWDGPSWWGGDMVYLSIRRTERSRLPRDWRDLQRIKNEIVGAEHEGFELFPAESRLHDGADQFHLFVLAKPLLINKEAQSVDHSMGVGWLDRSVVDHGVVEKTGGSQRPFQEGVAFHEPPLLSMGNSPLTTNPY